MKLAKTIILSLSAAFLIIGVHQTFTLGFGVSYWIFMLSISMFLLYKLIGSVERKPVKEKKTAAKPRSKKPGKKDKMKMNRQVKRHLERMK